MQYDILYALDGTPPGALPQWVLASTNKPFGPPGNNLFQILNLLARNGWQVVGTGDFGLSSRSEILIAHA